MVENSCISKNFNKMKTWKTFWEAHTASPFKEIIHPPPHLHQIKAYYISETKTFFRRYTELYRPLLLK